MATNVVVPNLGDSISEVTLLKWHKADGERVGQDEALCEVETDKANTDIYATAPGVVKQLVAVGTTVKVGDALASIDANASAAAPKAAAGEAGATPPASAASQSAASQSPATQPAAVPVSQPVTPPSEGPRANASKPAVGEGELSPAVRRLIDENHLDPAQIPPTGPGGRLTKEDVINHLESAPGDLPATAEPMKPAKPVIATPPASSGGGGGGGGGGALLGAQGEGVTRTPLSKIRKRIAENLVRAQQTAAILTTFNEVDLTNVMALRSKYKERFEKTHKIGLGFMSFFAKASAMALADFPRVNGQLDGDTLMTFDYVNLGIAVSTERGLAVPVLRGAQVMSFAKIESEIKRLAGAVRDGKLNMQELSGGTFTITNGGVFGSLLSTPIINPPQSAILGMHTIQKRPMVVDDKIEIRPMMYLALSYDHRVVDGKESVSFLVRIKELLEDPARMMLEV